MPEKAERRHDPELGYRQYTEGAFQRVIDNMPKCLSGALMHRDVAYVLYYDLMDTTESHQKFAKT